MGYIIFLFGNWCQFYSVIINLIPVGNTYTFTVDKSDRKALQMVHFPQFCKVPYVQRVFSNSEGELDAAAKVQLPKQ